MALGEGQPHSRLFRVSKRGLRARQGCLGLSEGKRVPEIGDSTAKVWCRNELAKDLDTVD